MSESQANVQLYDSDALKIQLRVDFLCIEVPKSEVEVIKLLLGALPNMNATKADTVSVTNSGLPPFEVSSKVWTCQFFITHYTMMSSDSLKILGDQLHRVLYKFFVSLALEGDIVTLPVKYNSVKFYTNQKGW